MAVAVVATLQPGDTRHAPMSARQVLLTAAEPSSGRLLAQETVAVQAMPTPRGGAYPPGTMLSWEAPLEASWTDTAPAHAKVQSGG